MKKSTIARRLFLILPLLNFRDRAIVRDTGRDGHAERQGARHTDRERGEAKNTAAARLNLNEEQTEKLHK